MFRVIKALNNNGIIAIDTDAHNEYILLGKGIGFGKKVNERMEAQKTLKYIFCRRKQTEAQLKR